MKLLCHCFCVFNAALLMLAVTVQAQEIIVHDAWIRGVPPSAKSTAAYMTIQNNGPDEMFLKSAAGNIAEVVQIHTMEHAGEMMKMKEVGELRIPANGQAVLAPMGYHIMLIGLSRPITEGEVIPLTLSFADGTSVSIEAVVKKLAPMGHQMGHQ